MIDFRKGNKYLQLATLLCVAIYHRGICSFPTYTPKNITAEAFTFFSPTLSSLWYHSSIHRCFTSFFFTLTALLTPLLMRITLSLVAQYSLTLIRIRYINFLTTVTAIVYRVVILSTLSQLQPLITIVTHVYPPCFYIVCCQL